MFYTYNELLDAGWRMKEIDEMDILGFLKVRAWEANRKKKVKPKQAYIDQVWSSLTPTGGE